MNRAKPSSVTSIQGKRHTGQSLICLRKPPKGEDNDNENTHYQRGHVKNVKYHFFSAKVDQRLQKTRHLSVLRSRDDKAYVQPGTSEGFEKVRNLKTLQLSDLEQLLKYDWPETLMYVTPGSHRIMTKDSVISAEGVESLVTKTDYHFCFCRPKAFIGSYATTWYSENVRVRHEYPSCLEVDPSTIQGFETYSKEFRSVYYKRSLFSVCGYD